MCKITFTLSTPMPFGKYKHKTIEQIITADYQYVQWMIREFDECKYEFSDEVVSAVADAEMNDTGYYEGMEDEWDGRWWDPF